MFGVGSEIDLTLKFKLRNTIIDVAQAGRIIRKSSGRVALQFKPTSQSVRRSFQQVIDDYAAREFANSQA
jgi:hypothetical protein